MSSPTRPLTLQQGITVQRVDNEVLLYDEQRHQAFCLNATTPAVWQLCNGNNTVAEISRSASLALGTPVPEAVVEFALAELRSNALLVAEPSAAPLPAGMSRRSMMQSLGARSLLLLPVVAVVLAPRAAQAYNGAVDSSTEGDGINDTVGQHQQTAAHDAAAKAAATKAAAVETLAPMRNDPFNDPFQINR